MEAQFPEAVQNAGNNSEDIVNQVRYSATVNHQAFLLNSSNAAPSTADVDAISESQLLKHRAEHSAFAGNANNADILALLLEMKQRLIDLNQRLGRIENEQLAQRQNIDQIFNGLTNIRPINNVARGRRGRVNARRARQKPYSN
ncbi:hypothetical protein MIR68_011877 [Amoeboaphelidium protococcarum]|nr:hypothetical protein MIR68_011877 [Amoeboaphelidium protococcarum]